MKHFWLGDFHHACEDATKLIDGVKAANVIKSAIFNGKVTYRIVRAGSVGDDTVLVEAEKQEYDGDDEQNVSSVINEVSLTSQIDSPTPQEHQERDNDNTSIIVENKLRSYFEATEKWFTKFEDHLTGFNDSKSTTGKVPPDTTNTDLLKNRISELERYPLSFLTSQIIPSSRDATKNINSSPKYRYQITDNSNKSNHHDAPTGKTKRW